MSFPRIIAIEEKVNSQKQLLDKLSNELKTVSEINPVGGLENSHRKLADLYREVNGLHADLQLFQAKSSLDRVKQSSILEAIAEGVNEIDREIKHAVHAIEDDIIITERKKTGKAGSLADFVMDSFADDSWIALSDEQAHLIDVMKEKNVTCADVDALKQIHKQEQAFDESFDSWQRTKKNLENEMVALDAKLISLAKEIMTSSSSHNHLDTDKEKKRVYKNMQDDFAILEKKYAMHKEKLPVSRSVLSDDMAAMIALGLKATDLRALRSIGFDGSIPREKLSSVASELVIRRNNHSFTPEELALEEKIKILSDQQIALIEKVQGGVLQMTDIKIMLSSDLNFIREEVDLAHAQPVAPVMMPSSPSRSEPEKDPAVMHSHLDVETKRSMPIPSTSVVPTAQSSHLHDTSHHHSSGADMLGRFMHHAGSAPVKKFQEGLPKGALAKLGGLAKATHDELAEGVIADLSVRPRAVTIQSKINKKPAPPAPIEV